MNTYDKYGRLVRAKGLRDLALTAVVLACAVALYCLYVPGRVSPLKFPGPAELIRVQRRLSWDLLGHAASTLSRVSLGFTLGSMLGVGAALLMFSSRTIELAATPFVEALRPIPPIALIPFFILWFGLHPAGQILLIGLGCFMVMAVSALEALRNVSIDLRRAARSLGVSGPTYYFRILLPAISPQLIGPLRVSLALAFALAVAAEFMGAQSGVGFLMMVARRTLQTETILLGVLVLGAESALTDYVLRTTLRRLTRWHG